MEAMDAAVDWALDIVNGGREAFADTSRPVIIWMFFNLTLVALALTWFFFFIIAPIPRPADPSEKTFKTLNADGEVTDPAPLPCWLDAREKQRRAQKQPQHPPAQPPIESPEVFISVIVPAYNEEARLVGMLEEAVNHLELHYGTLTEKAELAIQSQPQSQNGSAQSQLLTRRRPSGQTELLPHSPSPTPSPSHPRGWEILLIDDGSTDATVLTALSFARTHLLPLRPRRASGPWTHSSPTAVNIPPGSIRLVSLRENRGKGGAVVHGMRHARGRYVVFADADGASRFEDLDRLLGACQELERKHDEKKEDDDVPAVAVGSRAHLVGSSAVVQRSLLRNTLMHAFHLLLRLMTPPRTARIRDTQCGFKLFSRAALPLIVPHMHTEGWIFDVEMLMLAEFAGVEVVEVPVGWREVGGSKLNVLRDSLGMAWGLAVLRIGWGLGIYRRD